VNLDILFSRAVGIRADTEYMLLIRNT
jgi:predicted lipid carrier protein YhbT